MTTYKSGNNLDRLSIKSSLLIILILTSGTAMAGDRVFMKGNQWISGGTGDQLTDFDMIRLSSYKTMDHFKAVTDTLNRKLMIGLSAFHVSPPETEYPDTTLAQYNQGTGYLKHFEEWVDTLKTDSVSVAAFMINLEVPASFHTTAERDSHDVSIAYARMIREYVRIAKAAYDTTKVWVFSARHYDNFAERGINSCDWDSLTGLPNAIDVCYIGHIVNVMHPNMEIYKNDIRKWIDNTHDVANGKKIAAQIFTYDHGENNKFSYIRNNYHRKWEVFRELVSFTKSVTDSVNGGDSDITWYQTHISSVAGDYTLGNTAPPAGDIPWDDGGNYPARLWDDNHFWEWDHTVNQWEAEFVANFLTATGYTLPAASREISSSVTWQDTVVLLGDMEIKSGGSLTLGSSAVVKFRKDTDVQEGGADSGLAEIIVQSGGQLTATNTGTDTIRFQHDNLDSTGTWYGIRNLGGTASLDQCMIQDADIGVVSSSGTTSIEDCNITDCVQGIMALSPATVERTRIWNTATGVEVNFGSSQSMTLQNNLIHSNSSTGIWAEDSPVLAINSQTIANTPTGIYLDNNDAMEVDILNSILSKNWTYGILDEGSPTVTLNYSDVWGSSTPFSGSTVGSWSNPPNAEDGNEGNITSNPTFVDTSNADFHLDTGSPCINTGDPSMTDADASRIDMGCYGGSVPRASKPILSSTDLLGTPYVFSVDQNYPNPFNPETTISFTLPDAMDVTLKIYNTLGQEVRTLLQDVRPAGAYRVVWDGRDNLGRRIASGLYMYRLVAGDNIETRKMLVLK